MEKFDHRALARALRKCSPRCRIWLRSLPQYHYEPWGAAMALGFARGSVQYWLRQEPVREAMRLMELRDADEARITAINVLTTYRRLANSDIRKLYREDGTLKAPHELDDDTAAAVIEYSFDARGMPKIKLHEKRGANDALAKFLRLIVDRHEVTGKDGAPINPEPAIVNVIIDGADGG